MKCLTDDRTLSQLTLRSRTSNTRIYVVAIYLYIDCKKRAIYCSLIQNMTNSLTIWQTNNKIVIIAISELLVCATLTIKNNRYYVR